MSTKSGDLVPEKKILKIIILVRGEKVILDSDLAILYGVETRRLNEQVRRNIDKFPDDFMFQLTKEEFENLKSQFATSSATWGGRRKLPLVFTEHGALQAANVLNSPQANKMSVFIVRTFVKLREMALTNEKLSRKFIELEKRVSDHDEILIELIREIKKLIDSPNPKGKRPAIGFIEPVQMEKNKNRRTSG
ncbi:MAG: ORF6N domain-containing protein [Desulfobacteraceae bacterium]|nr:MAG: ORF6N domain-containing protein [Desulfobacteraceae bacterium]